MKIYKVVQSRNPISLFTNYFVVLEDDKFLSYLIDTGNGYLNKDYFVDFKEIYEALKSDYKFVNDDLTLYELDFICEFECIEDFKLKFTEYLI